MKKISPSVTLLPRTLSLILAAGALAACAQARPVAAPVTPSTTTSVVTPSAPPHVRNVAILLYQGVELLDFAGPGEVFSSNDAFHVYTVAESKKPLLSRGFVTIDPEFSIDDAPKPDIVVIPGGGVRSLLDSERAMAWLHTAIANDELTTSVCNGAYALAKDGSLDGKRATTHWHAVEGLRKAAPKVTVVPEVRYIDEGRVMTTAGVSAGIDGALHIVQRLLGDEEAWRSARYMMYAWEPEDGAVAGRPPLTRAERDAMRARVMGAAAH